VGNRSRSRRATHKSLRPACALLLPTSRAWQARDEAVFPPTRGLLAPSSSRRHLLPLGAALVRSADMLALATHTPKFAADVARSTSRRGWLVVRQSRMAPAPLACSCQGNMQC